MTKQKKASVDVVWVLTRVTIERAQRAARQSLRAAARNETPAAKDEEAAAPPSPPSAWRGNITGWVVALFLSGAYLEFADDLADAVLALI